jgi:hypothetical protein
VDDESEVVMKWMRCREKFSRGSSEVTGSSTLMAALGPVSMLQPHAEWPNANGSQPITGPFMVRCT